MARRRLFSIPPGVGFLPTFVDALLEGDIVPGVSRADGPFALADTTIYVPTRRAARALLAAFAAGAGAGATMLPRVRPLGAVDEDAELFARPDESPFAFAPDLPDAIGDIPRRFILAQLVLGWARALGGAIVRVDRDGVLTTDARDALAVGATPADAVALAGELAGLIDEFIVEGVPWSRVHDLVAEDYDRYWGITTRFLKIAIEQWPELLRAYGLIDDAERRARLIDREIRRLSGAGGAEPTIVLGSTGTNRATAKLMRAILGLERGAVVLPGLDQGMRDMDWRIVAGGDGEAPVFGHPQAMLARLMRILECSRDDVRTLGAPAPALASRVRFVSQAMAPEESTAGWRPYRQGRDAELAAALEDVALIESPDERTEALAIAIRLRETLETPGATASLVTPDRSIARRVQAELRRWGIDIDDSGGAPLGQMPAGAFARAALAAARDHSDVALAALLSHEAVAPAQDRARTRQVAALLEIAVLRATPHDPDALRRIDVARAQAQGHFAHPAARRIDDSQWTEITDLMSAVGAALAPLRAPFGPRPLADWSAAHRESMARLSAESAAPFGDDAAALDGLFVELEATQGAGQSAMRVSLDEYARLFDTLVASLVVRGQQSGHPRLRILGLLEARLLHADLVVLAGLDETVWPPQPKSDPFLNRPMRAQLGLTPPERRVGQSAHDFWMAIGAPRVVLTRALKRGGAPTVASRFLQRLSALADVSFDAVRARGAEWTELARRIDLQATVRSAARPSPAPPLDLRPRALSVTKIETLRRDPYAVYAEKILNLAPLGPLDGVVDVAEQGTAIHDALHELARRWPSGPLPPDARDILLAAARENLSAFFVDPGWAAFRWPRLVAGLDFVLDYESARRPSLGIVHGEVEGRVVLTLADGSVFKLSARADRIEVDRDGRARIIDYKTGVAPTAKQAKAGFASQLTLEAAMVERGGFATVGARPVDSALYLKLGGPNGGKEVDITPKGEAFVDLVADHWAELQKMLESWRDVAQGYASRPFVQYASRYSDYDHLARVSEWSVSGEDGE